MSPTMFAFRFEERGFSNSRRNDGYAPVLNVGRYRPPRKIVNRLSQFCEAKRRYRAIKKRNLRRNRQYLKRIS